MAACLFVSFPARPPRLKNLITYLTVESLFWHQKPAEKCAYRSAAQGVNVNLAKVYHNGEFEWQQRFIIFFPPPLSLRPIKLSFQMSSHSVTPSPWWPPQKRGKNVLWMLNREYEDPYCERVTRSSISFSLRDRHRVIISKSHSQGFRSSSLDMHSIALNFGACSSEVMIYSEWKIKRGDETQPWSLWRAPSQLTLFTPSVTLMCQLFHRPHVLFHFIFSAYASCCLMATNPLPEKCLTLLPNG